MRIKETLCDKCDDIFSNIYTRTTKLVLHVSYTVNFLFGTTLIHSALGVACGGIWLYIHPSENYPHKEEISTS